MDKDLARAFLSEPWTPDAYAADDIVEIFAIDETTAKNWILMIRLSKPVFISNYVLHHELHELIQDLISITPVSSDKDDLSPAARWLIEEGGWKIDTQFKRYRWTHPSIVPLRMTLLGALNAELSQKRYWEGQQAEKIEVEIISLETHQADFKKYPGTEVTVIDAVFEPA